MDNNYFVIKVINKITVTLSVYSSRFNTFSTISKTNTTKKLANKQKSNSKQHNKKNDLSIIVDCMNFHEKILHESDKMLSKGLLQNINTQH